VFPSLVSDVTESNGACPQLSARRLERYFLDRPLLAGDVDGRSASNCSDFNHIHCFGDPTMGDSEADVHVPVSHPQLDADHAVTFMNPIPVGSGYEKSSLIRSMTASRPDTCSEPT
jgi:hypothetical protein